MILHANECSSNKGQGGVNVLSVFISAGFCLCGVFFGVVLVMVVISSYFRY